MNNKEAFTPSFVIPYFLCQGRRGAIKKSLGKFRFDLSSGRNVGFTLVEMMIVVAIILVLAVILMPNMIRSKLNANESAAMVACKTIFNGLAIYVLQQEEFPASLNAITTPLTNPPYIQPNVVNALTPATSHNGYWFEYLAKDGGTGFTLRAHPKSNLTGRRHFFVDETGIIRYRTDEAVSEADPKV